MRFCYALMAMVAIAPHLEASAIVLNFEGLNDSEYVGSFYNGGAGGNDGITFSADGAAYIQSNLSSGDNTYTGLFGGESSPYTALLFCQVIDGACADVANAGTINVAGGFDGAFSLYYSAPDQFGPGGSVDIWSGLDGTGTTHAKSFALPAKFGLMISSSRPFSK